MLTEGLWRSDLRRRAAGVEDGRRRRRGSVARSAQGSWWGVAGPGRLRGPRRSRCGSPGGLRCDGAACSRRRRSSARRSRAWRSELGFGGGEGSGWGARGCLGPPFCRAAANLGERARGWETGVIPGRGSRPGGRKRCAAEKTGKIELTGGATASAGPGRTGATRARTGQAAAWGGERLGRSR